MTKAATPDEYLAGVPEPERTALHQLRAMILMAVPHAEELINYGVPMFRFEGKNLVSYAAAKAHCSFFVQSPAVMEKFAADVAGYDTSKGTIRFKPDKPIPLGVVKAIVQARVAEIEAAKKGKRPS